ncbi:hypothetical protein GCM10009430_24410 [Aquimarina litoralis]|uniref:Uncharacterized protein n=1 Tax=Aquimarina litoralis TaxID=584605 RepID=A0ABP3U185_9FLAO
MKPKLSTNIISQNPTSKLVFSESDLNISEACLINIKITPKFYAGGDQQIECGLRLRIKDQLYLKFDNDQYEIYKHYGIISEEFTDTFSFKLVSKVSLEDLKLIINAIIKIEIIDCKYSDRKWMNSVIWRIS